MALSVGGTPITPEQLATLQADLGIVVAEEITARYTSLLGTDDSIFLRSGVPGLVSVDVMTAAFGDTPPQTLTQSSRLDNSQTFYAPTVTQPSGGAAYIDHTLASGAGSVVGTLPAGVTASDTLLAIVYNTGGAGSVESLAAPSGWTAHTGVTENSRGARAFTAPGNVSTLTFTATGVERLVLIGITAPLRDHAFAAWDFDTPGQIANQPTPSVTAVLNDVCVSVYIQLDDGTGGALASPGSPQAGYTRELLDNAAVPRVSILSQASMPAGATGTISHDANANFATRFTFTGVFGS